MLAVELHHRAMLTRTIRLEWCPRWSGNAVRGVGVRRRAPAARLRMAELGVHVVDAKG